MALRTKHSNPFEPPGSEGQPSSILHSNGRRILFRCFGGLFLFASILPVCIILFFVWQDYWRSDRYPVRFVSYDSELVGVGASSSGLLLIIAVIVTLGMWALGITLLLLAWRR